MPRSASPWDMGGWHFVNEPKGLRLGFFGLDHRRCHLDSESVLLAGILRLRGAIRCANRPHSAQDDTLARDLSAAGVAPRICLTLS